MKNVEGVARFDCGMSHSTSVVNAAQRAMISAELPIASDSREHSHNDAQVAEVKPPSAANDCEHHDGHICSGCGTCASCCIGAFAPAPAVHLVVAQEVVNDEQQFLLSSFTGHTPARIERPPRNMLPAI